MDNSKNIGVADIISVVGIILLGIGCFLGLNFLLQGNLTVSIPCTLVLIGATYGLVFFLVKIKQVERNQKQNKVIELAMLIIGYIGIIGIISFFLFTHFLNVEMGRKEQITANAKAQLADARKMFLEYESYVEKRCNIYGIELSNAINNKKFDPGTYKSIGFDPSGPSDEDQKKLLVDICRKDLTPVDFQTLKTDAETNITDAENAIEAWNWLKIPHVIQGLLQTRQDWLLKLAYFSQLNKQGLKEPFLFTFDNNTDLAPELSRREMVGKYFLLGLIGLLICHLMILWPYIFGKRSSKMEITGKDGTKTGFDW